MVSQDRNVEIPIAGSTFPTNTIPEAKEQTLPQYQRVPEPDPVRPDSHQIEAQFTEDQMSNRELCCCCFKLWGTMGLCILSITIGQFYLEYKSCI